MTIISLERPWLTTEIETKNAIQLFHFIVQLGGDGHVNAAEGLKSGKGSAWIHI